MRACWELQQRGRMASKVMCRFLEAASTCVVLQSLDGIGYTTHCCQCACTPEVLGLDPSSTRLLTSQNSV